MRKLKVFKVNNQRRESYVIRETFFFGLIKGRFLDISELSNNKFEYWTLEGGSKLKSWCVMNSLDEVGRARQQITRIKQLMKIPKFTYVEDVDF